MAAESDKVANAAIDLAKAGSWKQLFKMLDEQEGTAGVLANARPAIRKYGLLHHAAWHGKENECKKLIENYRADPKSLSQVGEKSSEIADMKGFGGLAQLLRDYEELPGAPVSISVLLTSGCMLLETQLTPCAKVQELMKLANVALISRQSAGPGLEGNISAICSADGRVLELSDSLLAAGLAEGGGLTAVVSGDVQSLRKIEDYFHELIMELNRCSGNPSALTNKGFVFPSLQAHVDAHGSLAELGSKYYGVPGMYGGFNTLVVKTESGWRLTCESWCRVCEGSEKTHEITVTGIRQILEERT